jgi:hypothetical protein
MADQAAVIQELYNRLPSLPPDKAAIVTELARRYGVGDQAAGGAPRDAEAQMRNSALAGVRNQMLGQQTLKVPSPEGSGTTTMTLPSRPNEAPGEMTPGTQIVHGIERAAEPGLRAKAGGASQVLRGGMRVAGAGILPVAGAVALPETAAALALGTGASQVTEGGLKAAGVAPEYAELAGDVAGLAVPGAVHTEAGGRVIDAANAGVDQARNAAADQLDTSAAKNIATAINPTTKVNKALVRDTIAPGLIERGVTATSLKDLNEQANAKADELGQQIDDRFDAHAEAGHSASPKPIIAALEAERQQYMLHGEDLNPVYTGQLQRFQDQIQAISKKTGGPVPLDALRKIRQTYDKQVKQSKGGFALAPDDQSKVAALQTYTNAIRGSIADFDPALAADNKDFSFWQNVADVTDASLQRKTGQKAGLGKRVGQVGAGTVAAAVTHNPLTIAGAANLGGKLGDFMQSTAWNTLSAQVKTKIADLIRTGDEAGATALAKQNGVVPATATPATANASQSNGGTNGQATNGNAGTTQQGSPVSTPAQTVAQAGGGSARTSVRVPGQPGKGYPATYQLKELDDINASHNGLTFSPNAEYKLTNDRNYSNKANQGKIVTAATDAAFDPALHITDNPDATNGPIVTDSLGNAVAGNGRVMMLQRVYNAKGKAAAAYRQMLTAKAPQYGLDPAEVDQFKHPVLVRELDDAKDFNTANAVTDFNKVGTASLTPSERAIADSKRVSAATLDDVSGRLESAGPKATISSVLDGKPGAEILDKLIADGVVSPQERAGLANDNGLTKDGKERVSKLLVGRFFESPEQIDSVPANVRAKVERIAAPAAATQGLGDWDLVPKLREAVGIVDAAKKAGIPNISDFLKQDGLFGAAGKYSPEAVMLAKALSVSKSADIVAAARQFAQDAAYAGKGASLLGNEPTFKDSFAESFGKLKSGAAAEAEERALVPGSAEFRRLPYSQRQAILAKAGGAPTAVASASDAAPEIGPHGPVFHEQTGNPAEAIQKLQQERKGEVPGAFHNPDVGDIDLVWGEAGDPDNDYAQGYGLAKIIAKHAAKDPTLLKRLPDIIQNGEVVKRSPNRIVLANSKDKSVVRLEFDGKPKKWLLTAYGPE